MQQFYFNYEFLKRDSGSKLDEYFFQPIIIQFLLTVAAITTLNESHSVDVLICVSHIVNQTRAYIGRTTKDKKKVFNNVLIICNNLTFHVHPSPAQIFSFVQQFSL